MQIFFYRLEKVLENNLVLFLLALLSLIWSLSVICVSAGKSKQLFVFLFPRGFVVLAECYSSFRQTYQFCHMTDARFIFIETKPNRLKRCYYYCNNNKTSDSFIKKNYSNVNQKKNSKKNY